MYKNQLQELAQRSCFNLPSYTCTREGPDHAPRFKACVNFNGEIFESPTYCSTLRQAEHSAAEVALIALSSKGPSKSLTARVLDETGIYKNLLQETAHRAGLDLPVYTSVRSGPGHIPTFSCTVELAGMSFNGESAKTKKQAEKNAAIAAWFSLRRMPSLDSSVEKSGEEKEREVVARVLSKFRPKEVKRREPNQSRRRTIRQDKTSTRDLLCEKLRLINPYTNEALSSSSSTLKQQQQTLPPRFLPSRTNLQQQQSRVKSLLEKSQEHAVIKQNIYDSKKTEMITKSFPLPSNSTERNCYSKLLLFPEMFGGGFQKVAPAVHIRSVIPVCSAPPPPKPNPSNTSLSLPSAPSSLGLGDQDKKSLRPETNEGGDYKLITRRGSIGKDSEISESVILDQELSTHSKRSKTGGEKACKEEEDERENAPEEKVDEQKLSPSPSFRIYCVFPRDPSDNNVVDDLPRNKNISDVNKVESTKEKAHTKFACLKSCVK